MSVAQHTPGPWTAFTKSGKHVQADEWSTDCDGARSSTHAPIKAGERVVALVVASSKRWPDLPDIAPDCHLIAAAPELLAACVVACEWIAAGPEGARVLAQLRRAIRAAKGGAA